MFNHEVGVDVLDLHDYEGKSHLFLNIVDQGTNFQIVWYLCPGAGVPSSRLCAQAFMQAWVSWAGWPKNVVTDRGLHNRGLFSKLLGSRGICIKNVALESPEQLGRTERHGGMWKATAKRAIHAQKVKGTDEMIILALSNNSLMNDGTRKGGFAPSQWVLGKFPRNPGNIHTEDEFADLGVISAELDPDAAFMRMMQIRQACRGAFAAEDCSLRVQRAFLRKAAPLKGEYSVGNLIEFKRTRSQIRR